MNRFFSSFPTIYYPYLDGYKLATDILKRVNFNKQTKNNNAGLINYRLKDGDTPDNVAARFYGSPHLHWIVLLINDIVNPYYDWPLTTTQLDDYVTRKYGEGFRDQPHHYEILDKGIQIDYNEPLYLEDGGLVYLEGGVYEGLALLVYTSTHELYVGEEVALITNYQYEFAENNKKRNIKLLRPELVNQAITQLSTRLRDA